MQLRFLTSSVPKKPPKNFTEIFKLSLKEAQKRFYLQQLVHVVADVVIRQLLVKLLPEDILCLQLLNDAQIISAHDHRGLSVLIMDMVTVHV